METPAPPEFASVRINAAPNIYRCEVGWNWAPQPLKDHDFWLVISGSGQITRNDSTEPVAAGSCALLRPSETPRASQDLQDRLTVFYAHFDVLDANGNIGMPLEYPTLFRVRDMLSFATSAQRVVRLWQRGDAAARYQAQLVLGVLLWQLWDEKRFGEVRINEVFEMLATAVRHEPGRHWTLDDMARQTALSRAQFARRFRDVFGISPVQFVIQTRLERARHLLTETEMTAEQIAYSLGYADVYFFARQFKRFTGKTPGAVRKRL